MKVGAEVNHFGSYYATCSRPQIIATQLLLIQCALLVIVLGASAAAAQQVEAPAPAAPLPTPAEPLITGIKDVRAACISQFAEAAPGCPSPASNTDTWGVSHQSVQCRSSMLPRLSAQTLCGRPPTRWTACAASG